MSHQLPQQAQSLIERLLREICRAAGSEGGRLAMLANGNEQARAGGGVRCAVCGVRCAVCGVREVRPAVSTTGGVRLAVSTTGGIQQAVLA